MVYPLVGINKFISAIIVQTGCIKIITDSKVLITIDMIYAPTSATASLKENIHLLCMDNVVFNVDGSTLIFQHLIFKRFQHITTAPIFLGEHHVICQWVV